MTMTDIIDEIKLELTGNILETEIDDSTIESIIRKALRELVRYWDETSFVTLPFASCIDLTASPLDKEACSSVVRIYRTTVSGDYDNSTALADPMFAQQWMLFSNGGTMYNLNDYILNYASWNTLLQIKNTLSTDLAFREDKHNNKLYINNYLDRPSSITIEYIPKLTSVEQIQDVYWTDVLIKLSTALTKIVLGRIRTRYTQTNAQWTQDGDKLLEEGNNELKELRERLRDNDNMILGID